MSKIPNESVVPPSGFHFTENAGQKDEITLRGNSYREVAALLLQYRLANKRPPGEPLREVYAFVCSQWPHFCREYSPSPDPAKAPPRAHFSTEVLRWVNRLWKAAAGSSASLVADSLARSRAEVCAACPMQRTWDEGGCGSCVQTAKQTGYIYRGGRSVGLDSGLRACSVTKQDNLTAVWSAKLPPLSVEERAQLPAQCWRKREGA